MILAAAPLWSIRDAVLFKAERFQRQLLKASALPETSSLLFRCFY
jgi:hypothetical protein